MSYDQKFIETVTSMIDNSKSRETEELRKHLESIKEFTNAPDGSFEDQDLGLQAGALGMAMKALLQIRDAMSVADVELDTAELVAAVTLNDIEEEIAENYLSKD